LTRNALTVVVKKRMGSHAAWQMRDASGAWICPYCTMPSSVQIRGKVDRVALTGIVNVIATCSAFHEKGYDGFHSVEEIKQSAATRTMIAQSIEDCTSWMSDD
jgi:hypothetical protein